MVEPMFHKEKIMTIGNILREIRKSVNKKSQMSLRDMLVLAHLYLKNACKLESHRGGGYGVKEINKNVAKYVHNPAALCRDAGNIK